MNSENQYKALDYFYQKIASANPNRLSGMGIQTGESAVCSLDIPASDAARLEQATQGKTHSQYVIFLATLSATLYKYTVSTPIVSGETMRPAAEKASPSTIFYPLSPDGKSSFRELVQYTAQEFGAAHKHRNFSLPDLLDQVQLNLPAQASALFHVGLHYDQLASGVRPEASAFELLFAISRSGQQFTLNLHFQKLAFEEAFVRQIGQHFLHTLHTLLHHPDTILNVFDILSDAEFKMLTEDFNPPATDIGEIPAIQVLIAQQAQQNPDKPAIFIAGKTLSLSELDEQANQLANFLVREYGIQNGDVVALSLPRTEQLIVTMLAILKAGAAFLPLGAAPPAERLAHILVDSQCVCLIQASPDITPPDSVKVLRLDQHAETIAQSSRDALANAPEGLAYLIYTSGSTGLPKGVRITHANLRNFIFAMNSALGLDSSDKLLAVSTGSFDISILELLWTLSRGVAVEIKSDSGMVSGFDHFAQDGNVAQLDFSLFYFSSQDDLSEPKKYRLLLDSAEFADAHEFSAVWTPERHFHEFGGIFPDPAITGAAIAARTQQIGIRSGSVVLPLHDTIRVAEQWAMVDNLSQGRVGLSIASGWHADDFVFFPDRFENRRETMYEQLAELKALWAGEKVRRTNGLGKEIEIQVHPKPISDELPIWITSGGSPETFRRAGQVGAGILTHFLGQELEDLANNILIYKTALQENGHPPERAQIALMLHTFIGDDLETVREKVRAPFKEYLRSNLGLMRQLARSRDIDLSGSITSETLEALLSMGFERFWQQAALFGTTTSCRRLLDQLAGIGITEIACLVDFGLSYSEVMAGLPKLNALREAYSGETVSEAKVSPPTALQTTPSLLQILANDIESRRFLRGLKHLIIGGERLPASVLHAVQRLTNARIYHVYGPTETTIWSTMDQVGSDPVLSIGRPIANTYVYVLDEHLKLVPPGVPGEIVIGGLGVAAGYQNRPDLNAQKFIADPVRAGAGVVYRTGDFGCWRADGKLTFLGRKDGQLKILGHRVEIGEIEAVLNRHPMVTSSVVRSKTTDESSQLEAFLEVDSQTLANSPQMRIAEMLKAQPTATACQLPNGIPILHLEDRATDDWYQKIFANQIYLRNGIQILEKATIVDVGANIGLFGLFVADHCNSPQLYTFEPNPELADIAKTNLELYLPEARFFQSGMSSRQDTEAGLTTLSEFIRAEKLDQIDLLRIQAPDSEVSVLQGIKTKDWQKIHQLVLEVASQQSLPVIQRLLTENGLQVSLASFSPTGDQPKGPSPEAYTVYAHRGKGTSDSLHSGGLLLEKALTPVSLRQFLNPHLPSAVHPQDTYIVHQIPLSTSGKIDRKALATENALQLASQSLHVSARTESEKLLVAVCQELLNIPSPGIFDNFFVLGGNSLKAVQLALRIQKLTHVQVPLRHIFQAPTIAAIAQLVDNGTATPWTEIPKLPDADSYDLSHAQTRLWVLDQLPSNRLGWIVSQLYRIQGPLDIPRLAQACLEVVKRHEALRTNIIQVSASPRQLVHPHTPDRIRLQVLDFQQETDPQAAATAYAQNASVQTFDLAEEPLFRVFLLCVAATEYRLLIVSHHIIIDGWSIYLLVIQLIEAYLAGTPGTAPGVPVLQYRDFAAWHNARLSSPHMQAHETYWLSQFPTRPAALNFPDAKPRPKVQTFQGSATHFQVSAAQNAWLAARGESEAGTIFMRLLAGLHLTLYALTGENQFCIGTPVAGRDHLALESMAGLFLNTLALHIGYEEDASLAKIFQNVQQTALAALDHQEYPFDKLVKQLQFPRDLSRNPLFDVGFTLHNEDQTSVDTDRLDISISNLNFEMETKTIRADLWLHVSVVQDVVQFQLVCNDALFDKSFGGDFASYLITVIDYLQNSPEIAAREVRQTIETMREDKLSQRREHIRTNRLKGLRKKQ